MEKILVLFDIDGTLVMPYRDNITHNRFAAAFNRVFGTKVTSNAIDYNGKTLKRIFLDFAQAAGIKRSSVLSNMDRLFRYERDFMKQNGKYYRNNVIKGVFPLLKELRKSGYPLGLVTGNSSYSSGFKLRKSGLKGFFKVGGFGEMSDRREVLVLNAIKAANSKFGTRFSKKNVFYFGDAPLDIEAGRKAGINMIAVATGWCTMKELRRCHPDYLLKDLTDLGKVLKILSQ